MSNDEVRSEMDDRNHPSNEGRESLFDLEVGKTYFVEGSGSGEYSTFKATNTRFALKEVLVKEYRDDISYDDIPIIAFASHINTIRRQQGLEYANLKDGARSHWIGILEEYESTSNPGIKRRSFKLKRDANILLELRNIERRLVSLNGCLDSLKPKEVITRLTKTQKMLERVENIRTTFQFVPWLSPKELQQRIQACLEEVSFLMPEEPDALDDLLANL